MSDPSKKTFALLGKKRGGSSSSSSSSTRMKTSDESCRVKDSGTPSTITSSSSSSSSNEADEANHSFWSLDLDRHYLGKFSFAAMKGNSVMEDYSEVVVGRKSTFIGIYDGHGGHEVAEYVFNELFKILMGHVSQTGTMSEGGLTQAFHEIEDGWVAKVEAEFNDRPPIASIGASCLVGVIWGGNLYTANAGGCRAIRGDPYYDVAIDHNMRHSQISIPLRTAHAKDHSNFGEPSGETYLIKGRTVFPKSIGDSYLKHPRFNLDNHGFKLNEPLHALDKAPVESVPSTSITPLATLSKYPYDGNFIVLASHGFWAIMRDEDVTSIVKENLQNGIAARLIREALKKVAEKEKKNYTEILNMKDPRGRNIYHDDITVVVIFINKDLRETVIEEQVSVSVGKRSLSVLDNALQGAHEALERTEPAGDLDQALQGEDEGADEALESTQPAELDQTCLGANVGR